MIAFLARVIEMLHNDGVLGVHFYDAGVYYTAADALTHGQLPYQNVLFIEAPGVIFVTLPFAVLGNLTTDSIGLASANLAFAAIGAACTAMVVVNLRRFGLVAALSGGFFYAITDAIVVSERSIRLEPVATLLLLITLTLLASDEPSHRQRRDVIAGILLGLATGFKIWYIVPALVIFFLARGRRRRIVAGGAAGAFAIYLPFFLGAPAIMFRQVVLDQLGRPRESISIASRLHAIIGEPSVPAWVSDVGLTTVGLSAAVLMLVAVLTVVAWRTPAARLYVWLFLSGAAVLVLSPSFFVFYAALTSYALALVTGVAFGTLATVVPARKTFTAGMTVIVMAGMLAVSLPKEIQITQPMPPLAGLRHAAAAVNGCVLSDNNAILIAMNVLSRDLAEGCLIWPDTTGWTFDAYAQRADGHSLPRADNTVWQKHAVGYLTSGAAVLQYHAGTLLNETSSRLVREGPVLFHGGDPWTLYATPHRLGPAPSTPERVDAARRRQ